MNENSNQLAKNLAIDFLTTHMSHFPFDKAIEKFPEDRINDVPENAPFNFWELLEHIRRMFQEIMDYIIDPNYEWVPTEFKYWPKKIDETISIDSWNTTIDEIKRLNTEIEKLLENENTIIFDELQHQKESGHTYLRQIMMIMDHNAYHLGQFILMRKLLGIWD